MRRLIDWMLRFPGRAFVVVAMGWALLNLGSCVTQQPRQDRAWYPYLSNLADVELAEDRFTVRPVIDWTYNAAGPLEQRTTEAAFALSELRNVWFVIEPQPGSRLAAHTFLLFEFEGDRLLGATVEARREEGEDYDAVRGLWNTFELSYIWASARDLLVRRAVFLDHDVFVYPIAISDVQERTLLTRMLARTSELETRPRFYNTLFSNCTNELAKATDLDWHYSFVLTGASDNHLFRLGLIPGESFEAAHARSDVTQWVKDANEGVAEAGFDAALLAELRRRSPS